MTNRLDHIRAVIEAFPDKPADFELYETNQTNSLIATYTGYDAFLNEDVVASKITATNSPDLAKVTASLERDLGNIVRMQRLRQERLSQGLLIDRPLAGLLKSLGHNSPEFVNWLKANWEMPKLDHVLPVPLGRHPTAYKAQFGVLVMKKLDLRIPDLKVTVDNGIIHSAFTLSRNVLWSRDHVILKKTPLPKTIVDSLADCDISQVIDHPDLSGKVKTVMQSNGSTLSLYLKDQQFLPV